MGKLTDKLERAEKGAGQPLGFGGAAKRESIAPLLLLGAVAAGDAGRQQGLRPARHQVVERAIVEPRPVVDGGFATGLPRGVEADALADPTGVGGQVRHSLSLSCVSR